jgi:hypothetical protein
MLSLMMSLEASLAAFSHKKHTKEPSLLISATARRGFADLMVEKFPSF